MCFAFDLSDDRKRKMSIKFDAVKGVNISIDCQLIIDKDFLKVSFDDSIRKLL